MSLLLFHRRYHGIDDNPGHGLISGVKDAGDNLWPVTTTPAILIAGVVDTGEQLFAVVVDTKLRKSPRIFVKIRK